MTKLEVEFLMKAKTSGLFLVDMCLNGLGSAVTSVACMTDGGKKRRWCNGGVKETRNRTMCSTTIKSSEQPSKPTGSANLRGDRTNRCVQQITLEQPVNNAEKARAEPKAEEPWCFQQQHLPEQPPRNNLKNSTNRITGHPRTPPNMAIADRERRNGQILKVRDKIRRGKGEKGFILAYLVRICVDDERSGSNHGDNEKEHRQGSSHLELLLLYSEEKGIGPLTLPTPVRTPGQGGKGSEEGRNRC
jgi:hypothetical protein